MAKFGCGGALVRVLWLASICVATVPALAEDALERALKAADAALARSAPGPASAAASAAASIHASGAAMAGSSAMPHWISVPRIAGRITASDIGLVINTADPYSVEVGEYYIEKRHLQTEQVLRVELPLRSTLTLEEFDKLRHQITEHFGDKTQALALAWTAPYAVLCNSITGALALGFDATLCKQTCAVTRPSPYFNSRSGHPFTDLALRPSMLIAAPDVQQARALIDRGVASDHSLGLRGAPPADAWFLSTNDPARNARAPLFPPPGVARRFNVNVKVINDNSLHDAHRVLLYEIGLTALKGLDTLQWLPGALADDMTSFGGQLDKATGQTTALDFIASGATASYGTVSEPCSHPQKFAHPQVLLLNYLQGSSAIEAYWKSVAWPQQGLFIGEPLAAPFAR